MPALIYFFAALFLGDFLGRRFLVFRSVQHRAAVALLAGLLFSTCITYLTALLFARTGRPLIWANTLFFVVITVLVFCESGMMRKMKASSPSDRKLKTKSDRVPESLRRILGTARYSPDARPPGCWSWDLACLVFCLLLGSWLFFATLDFQDGSFVFAVKSWSDFGANLSLAQSMALGGNYPTEHPFYPGETVRYHFLFWFLSANLSYLGANIVWAINILSILSLLALIVLLITFAEVLFNSRAVARIAAVLFFFASSSLSYIPFLAGQESLAAGLQAIVSQKDYLKSGFPYRGDDWGSLSVAVFSNQRQLISAVGIVLIVLIFLVEFYRTKGVFENLNLSDADIKDEKAPHILPNGLVNKPLPLERSESFFSIKSLIFCGVLIGALPFWNSAVFVAAAIILASLFVLFPFRSYLSVLIASAAVIGLPQILMLRSGSISSTGHSLFHWGYIVADPTVAKVLQYIGWTFGLKLALVLFAFVIVPAAYRKLLLALTAPAIVVFVLQLSTDVFNNHKLLNIWNVLISVYVAYGLWFIGRKNVGRAILSAALAAAMILGAVIDLFPIRNDAFVSVPHQNDRLTEWLLNNTAPSDIFLSDTLLSHPILFSGRKVFLGNTLFAWTAGYEMADREKMHRRMLTTQDLAELRQILAQNRISYMAIEDGLRTNKLIKGLNESLVRSNFELVFADTEKKYGNLKIYRVTAQTDSH